MAINFLNTVAVDDSVLFVDTTNDRVGIGTASPGFKLEVSTGLGSGSDGLFIKDPFAGTSRTENSKNPMLSLGTSTENGSAATIFMGANATPTNQDSKIEFNRTGGYLSIWYKGTGTYREHVRYGNPSSSTARSVFFGNVGIGTTSPSVELEVAGNIGLKSDSAYLRFRNAAAADLGYITNSTTWGDSGSDFSIGASSSNLRFYTNNSSTERMRIDSSGNVGIGTTSPLEPLSINSGTNESVYDALGVYNSVTGTSALGKGTAIRIGSGSNGNYSTKIATIYEGNNPSYLQPALAFFTMNNTYLKGSETEKMRISANGNVGIGTTSPAAKLDIISSGLSTMFRLSNTEANATTKYGAILGRHYTNAEENVTGMLITSSSSATGGSVSIGGGISSANAVNEIKFYTAANNTTLTGTERMRITSGGNVGIGTTSPQSLLEVSGSIASTIPALGEDSDLFQVGGTTYGTMFGSVSNGNGFIQQQRFDGSATAYNLLLQPNGGNVGIGTTSPSRQLTLSGNSSPIISLASNTTLGEPSIYFGDTADDNEGRIVYSNSQDAMQIWTAAEERIRIASDGDVGIGTTSPSQKLEVSTDAQIVSKFVGNTNDGTGFIGAVVEIETNNDTRGRGIYLTHRDSSDTSDSEWYMGTPYNGGGLSIGNAAYGTSLNSATGPADKDQSKLFITEAGNVGIGTTSPSVTLDVNGDILISNSGDKVFTTDSQNGAFTLGDIDALADEAIVQGDGSFIFLKNAGNTTLTTTVDNRVGIGTNSPGSKLDIVGATTTGTSSLLRVRTTDNPNAHEKVVGFYVNTSTERGFISVNQYATAYSTSSDYRLKENIVPISNGVERLKELNPCRFNFIGADYTVDGFLAHEAAEVVPEAVTGDKDAVDEDNNPSYQGIDQSKVVPLLTAALQEAIEKIEQLEIRIQTLENN